MCAPGVKVSLDGDTTEEKFKNKRGLTTVAPKDSDRQEIITKLANPLAIPLKVPGMG